MECSETAYLLGTRSLGITFSGDSSKNALSAFCDSDYAGNVDTRRSTSGYLLFLNNGPISWYSKRQKCVALSTTEAECIAMCEASKKITWMRHFLRDIDALQTLPTILLCDNQSAIKLVDNPEFHQRTKHIDVKYHFIREQQTNGTIGVNYIESQNQRADILTKPLSRPLFFIPHFQFFPQFNLLFSPFIISLIFLSFVFKKVHLYEKKSLWVRPSPTLMVHRPGSRVI